MMLSEANEKRVSTAETLNGITSQTDFDVGHNKVKIDHVREEMVIRKLDIAIIPPAGLLYIISFIDRVNIGNARLFGLEQDLGLYGSQFQIAVSLFFVTYIIFELPSNLLLKKLRPSRCLSIIALGWGIVATLTGVVRNFAGLVACRLLMGVFEAGVYPGLVVYLTMFYTKREIALRVAYLTACLMIAGGLGGLLAYGIGHMDGAAGLRGWRWIMIIEGIPGILIGVALWFWLADAPETAWYLNDDDRKILIARKQRQAGWAASGDEFHKRDLILALKDWKVWAYGAGQFCTDTMMYSYQVFLPTIISGLGTWSPQTVQALTIPCYMTAAIFYLVVAWLSDRTQQRGIPVIGAECVCVIGYAILVANTRNEVHYFGCFLAGMGMVTAIGLAVGWQTCNFPRYGKRTTATAIQVTVGNAAGILSPFLYKTNEGPRYVRGHAVSMGMAILGALIFTVLTSYFRIANRRREDGKEDHKFSGLTEEEVAELGDDSPKFRFTI